ncbi:MAG: hypothetical protein IPK19_17945 [Chloroflexi bacterium]|nr:hypothetical protein [Chloroflexota bacterium]
MSNPHTDVFIVIDEARRVLLVKNALPHLTHDFHFWQSCAPANEALAAYFGINAVTVRAVKTEWGENDSRFTYLMEYQSGSLPMTAAWAQGERIPAEAREALAWYAADHPLRVEWYRPQFVDRLTADMRARFGAGVWLEQVRSWGRSAIWRLVDDDGVRYLKIVPPMLFAHEPTFSERLARAFPGRVPEVVARQVGRWFVAEDYSGESLFAEPLREVGLWERALRAYARWQQTSRDLAIEAAQAGELPTRDMGWMLAHFRALLADDAALGRGYRPIAAEERARIDQHLPRIETALRELNEDGLLALTHGDFWAGQIILTDDNRLLFTDWSDSTLSHPFFDAAFFLSEIAGDLPDAPNAGDRLARAYLEEWEVMGPVEELLPMYRACEIAAPLYTALRYYLDILPQMEIPWEMENMLNYNLRLMLRALDGSADANVQENDSAH